MIHTATGYGLVQWTPAEKFFERSTIKSAKAAKELVSKPKTLIKKQLNYLIKSSKSTTPSSQREWWGTTKYSSPYNMTYAQYRKSQKSAGDLAKVFHGSYERSGDGQAGIKTRASNANKWYEHFKNR